MVRDVVGKHPDYYEAILQLREVSQEVVDFAEKEMVRVKLPISKVSKVKNGLDYFLFDNELTRAVGKKLQKRFGGELKVTASLHTKKKGKELFRVTVLFRSPTFRKGDLVNYGGEEFKVRLMGKDILLQHSKSGEKVHVKYGDMGSIKKLQQ